MQNITNLFLLQKSKYQSEKLVPLPARLARLTKLKKVLQSSQNQIEAALFADFKKAPIETALTEIYPVFSELDFAIRNLKAWLKPRPVSNPFPLWGSKGVIHYEPKGLCLIISPWNYPFQLAMVPLIAAIAAGNRIILKPSELTPRTSELIEKICLECFEPEWVTTIQGDKKEAEHLLSLPFNHIFFTGSPRVGKVVMRAAAEHLASVTLELGGKSPVIIDATTDLKYAAEKIAWGKSINAGQTCVAPDYILIEESILEQFKAHYTKAIYNFYGSVPEQSDDLAQIITRSHYDRLKSAANSEPTKDSVSNSSQKIPPCLIEFKSIAEFNISESILTKEEVFGPPLAVVPFSKIENAISHINQSEKPLVIYLFSKNKPTKTKIINETSSGGLLINDVLIHLLNPNLPFGGVNQSGFGNYHGFAGFRTFSHEKSVMTQGLTGYLLKALYPPYTERHRALIRLLIGLK